MVCEWDHGRCKSGGRVDLAISNAIEKLKLEKQEAAKRHTQQVAFTRIGRVTTEDIHGA